jgi:hypothetical protein
MIMQQIIHIEKVSALLKTPQEIRYIMKMISKPLNMACKSSSFSKETDVSESKQEAVASAAFSMHMHVIDVFV